MVEFFDELSKLDPRQRELIELLLAREQRASHVASRPPATAREAALASIWQEVLGVSEIGTDVNFFDLGGDSILSMQVVSRARRRGFTFGTKELFEHPTIAELARLEPETAQATQRTHVSGRLEVTPIQRWFFSLELPNRNHWNLEALIQSQRPLRLASVRGALQAVVDHHEMLRLRCSSHGAVPDLFVLEQETAVVGEIELQEGEDPASVLSPLHGSLDLVRGPVIRVAAIRSADGDCRHLAIVVHHLAVDWVSMRILLEDLEIAYVQLESGLPPRLPAKTSSYQQYAEYLRCNPLEGAALAKLRPWHEEMLYAARVNEAGPKTRPMTESSTRWVEESVSTELTQRMLRNSRAVLQADVHEVLLHAAASGLRAIGNTDALLIDVETHGRDALPPEAGDFARSVGWFAQIVPVLLKPCSADPLTAAISRTVEAWRTAQEQAVAYMRACYAAEQPGHLEPAKARFGFNYLGQFGSAREERGAFRLLATPAEDVYAREGMRPHAIEIVAFCLDGRLHMRWGYSDTRYSASVIDTLARATISALEAMLSVAAPAARMIAADFPEAELDAEDLAALLGHKK